MIDPSFDWSLIFHLSLWGLFLRGVVNSQLGLILQPSSGISCTDFEYQIHAFPFWDHMSWFLLRIPHICLSYAYHLPISLVILIFSGRVVSHWIVDRNFLPVEYWCILRRILGFLPQFLLPSILIRRLVFQLSHNFGLVEPRIRCVLYLESLSLAFFFIWLDCELQF